MHSRLLSYLEERFSKMKAPKPLNFSRGSATKKGKIPLTRLDFRQTEIEKDARRLARQTLRNTQRNKLKGETGDPSR